MSEKTGRYLYVKGKGFVKVSDRPPNVQVFDCYCPETGYYSENLERHVSSRSEKRRLLREQGLKEQGELTKREV